MLFGFFFSLRTAGLRPSLGEFLMLLEALAAHVVVFGIDDFYLLARTALVKDESQFDRYDQAFAAYFKGVEQVFTGLEQAVPEAWLCAEAERLLSDEEKARVAALGGWEALMDTLRQRLAEQKEAHHGGSKWIGTGGTSPFGHSGYHPEGIRIGGKSRHRRAVKVWERREFRDLDAHARLGTRNIQLALRRLRRFAREGAAEELDLDGTVRSTARNAGYLDLRMVPERHNAVRLLLFFDVGGSMDPHIRACEELFSAARSEFKHLENYYFHNFVYESVWQDNRRRHAERTPIFELLNRYGPDYRVVFVGDATMSPYEILQPGGSVEHWNQEAGAVWLQRVLTHFPHYAWFNPEPGRYWDGTPSISITRRLLGADRMYPLTLDGLEAGMKRLGH